MHDSLEASQSVANKMVARKKRKKNKKLALDSAPKRLQKEHGPTWVFV